MFFKISEGNCPGAPMVEILLCCYEAVHFCSHRFFKPLKNADWEGVEVANYRKNVSQF